MGQDPGRIRAAGNSHAGTAKGKAEAEQSWQGKHRGRIEETVGRKESGNGKASSIRKEDRCQEDGSKEGMSKEGISKGGEESGPGCG